MTLNKLASLTAKREGKKTQARIGEHREIIGILSDIVYELSVNNPQELSELFTAMVKNGKRRASKKKK